MTFSPSPRSLALIGAGAGLALLLDQPAQAHGLAHGGFSAGLLHPIGGADHLLLLVAVGAAAASLSAQLLVWALAGAIAGALVGSLGGSLPGQEMLAALAITAVALLAMRAATGAQAHPAPLGGALVAAAVAVHAMLHGLEAPAAGAAALWWLGAFSGSLLVCGGTVLALRRLPLGWTRGIALLLALGGGVAALGGLA
jgi:urease accessory protein